MVSATPIQSNLSLDRPENQGVVGVGAARADLAYTATHQIVGDRGQVISASSLERLEELDDAIFGALSGDPEALDAAPRRYDAAMQAVDRDLLNTALKRYRQKANEALTQSRRSPLRDFPKGFAALEILDLLSRCRVIGGARDQNPT